MNKNLGLLALCQGLFLTNNVTFIAINGLVGLALAPLGWMATLPVMGYVVGGALSTGLVARNWQTEVGVPNAPPTAVGPASPQATSAVEQPRGPNVDLSDIDPLAPRYKEWDEKAKQFQTAEVPKRETLPFGADRLGRDVLAKAIKGTEISVFVGVLAALLATAIGTVLGALAGFFGIGQIPTGDKDPFGLRRAALGVLRILMEAPLPLDLDSLIKGSAAAFPPGKLGSEVAAPLYDFMLERLRNTLRDAGHSQDVVDAVLALKPTRIDLVVPKLDAVLAFQQLPEAAALAAANKRIVNILKKAEGEIGEPDVALLVEDAEKALFHAIVEVAPLARSHFQNEAYTDALRVLAGLRTAVDRFFDEVMVMAEEALIRQNRLALLQQLAGLMNQVADISRLSA